MLILNFFIVTNVNININNVNNNNLFILTNVSVNKLLFISLFNIIIITS